MPVYRYFLRVFLIAFFVVLGVISAINDNNLANYLDAYVYTDVSKYSIAAVTAAFYTAVTYIKFWRISTRKQNLTLHV